MTVLTKPQSSKSATIRAALNKPAIDTNVCCLYQSSLYQSSG
jgi:hypothetical protein